MSHGHARLGESTPRSVFYDQGRFGRLFPTLPVFAEDTQVLRDALAELGAKNGPMDAADDLSDPITLITDPAKSVNNPGQSRDHRGLHLPRSVHRPRHDLRPNVESGSAAGSGVDPQLPDPRARPRQRVRKRTRRVASSLRLHDRRGTNHVSPGGDTRIGGRVGRRRIPASTSPATARTPRSSAIPATTRT